MAVQPDPDETALTYIMALASAIDFIDQSMQGKFKDDFIRLLDKYVEGGIVGTEKEGLDIRKEVEATQQLLKQCLEIVAKTKGRTNMGNGLEQELRDIVERSDDNDS